MVKKIILNSFIWLIIVGCISYAVAWVLGDPTPTILQYKTVDYGNGITVNMYQLNVHAYLQNLENTLDIPFKDMYLDFPKMYTITTTGNSIDTVISILKQMPNSYIYLANIILWLVNITVIMPTKLLIHPIIFILSILGINTTNLGIVQIANKIYQTNIEYILYV